MTGGIAGQCDTKGNCMVTYYADWRRTVKPLTTIFDRISRRLGDARLEGIDAARSAMHLRRACGEKDEYVSRALQNIAPFPERSRDAA